MEFPKLKYQIKILKLKLPLYRIHKMKIKDETRNLIGSREKLIRVGFVCSKGLVISHLIAHANKEQVKYTSLSLHVTIDGKKLNYFSTHN